MSLTPKILSFLLLLTVVSVPALAQSRFQVVYVNEEAGTYAVGRGSSMEAATRKAAEACGPNCQRAGWSRDACLAFTRAVDGGTCWGCDWADSLGEANEKARRRCEKYGCQCGIIWSDCYQ